MAKQFQVPFDEKGNQLTWDGYITHERKDNYEFEATLEYAGHERGRSALNIVWTDVHTGVQYRSGMAMLESILTSQGVYYSAYIHEEIGASGRHADNFTVVGKFTFKKQGTSVLLTLTKDKI